MESLSDKNTVAPEANAADALDQMRRLGRENLLVADKGQLLGIVAQRDLAAYLSITMKIDANRPVALSRE